MATERELQEQYELEKMGSPYQAFDGSFTADYTVDGVHKTEQYVIDVSFAIQFGEVV